MATTRALISHRAPNGAVMYINDEMMAQRFVDAIAASHSPPSPAPAQVDQCDEIASRVLDRLAAIFPILLEKELAVLEDRPPRINGSSRVRRNVAEHVFAKDFCFGTDVYDD